MSRAVLTCFHKYTPFGSEFYEVLLDFYLQQMKKFENEYDHIYLVDSNWDIDKKKLTSKMEVIKVNPHLRYYDAYKEVLPQIKEDLVLLMDNDMIVYREKCIEDTFEFLNEGYGIVSIYDTIGTFKTDKMNGKNKFCPYWFATRKDLLMKYRNIEWGPEMPEYETLGRLTEEMLKSQIKCYEFPEDKSGIYLGDAGGILSEGAKSLDTGVYHIRAGSTPAYLLSTKKYGNIDTYNSYLRNQPKQELLRQCAWYWYMCNQTAPLKTDLIIHGLEDMLEDMGIDYNTQFKNYIERFIEYHNLPE